MGKKHPKPIWDFTFSPLKVSKNTFNPSLKLLISLSPKPLSNIGSIYYNGTFAHNAGKYTAKGQLNTDAGNVQLATIIHGKNIQGTVNTTDLNACEST